MVTRYRRFLRLLELEIESLHDEIEVILGSLDERLAKHEITEYVRNENCAVLRNELLGLDDCLRARFEERADATVDEIAAEVKSCVRQRLIDHEYVPALFGLVSRRIDKIAAYLSSDDPTETAHPSRTHGCRS